MKKKLTFLVSLTTNDNDYQLEQAAAAEKAGRGAGVTVQVIYAGNDAINQSQQLLKAIQAPLGGRPDAIIFEPVGGTALPQVARQAASASIGWVVLNRDADYISEIRKTSRIPICSISSDHEEIGRIQGRQFARLLPAGGRALYIQGPSENSAAQQRTSGMMQTKPANIQVSILKAQWTEASAHKAVSSWLRLSTSQKAEIDLVGAQDDSMAMGARKAFEESAAHVEKDRWLRLPFTGCDGLKKTGQEWVRNGLLAATIIIPPNAGMAVEMLTKAISSGAPMPEHATTAPTPFPAFS